jgi:hypothetical protein
MEARTGRSVVQRSVTISKHLVDEGVRVAGPRGFSALVDEALDRELRRRRMNEVLDGLDETFGPVSDEAERWAAKVLEVGPRRR